jgi:hypothetical protein
MIKIMFHEKNATIRWKNPMERDFLRYQLATFRDAMKQAVPISVKDEKGEIHIPPKKPIPTPPSDGIIIPQPDAQPGPVILTSGNAAIESPIIQRGDEIEHD